MLFSLLGWSERGEPVRERKLKVVARGLAVAALVLVGILGWAGIVEPRLMLDTQEQEARVPALPATWEGAEIAVVADFQVGLWLDNPGMMRKAVEAIVDRNPDIAIIAGDFIYHPQRGLESRIETVLEVMEPLITSDIPTYAVLGNHDWGLPKPVDEAQSQADVRAARVLEDSLEARGVTVLQNQAVVLPIPASTDPDAAAPATAGGTSTDLYLVGVGARYMKLDRPDVALRELPDGAARFTVMHNPSSFPEFPEASAPIAVAGHTHGGQFRLPLTPEWSWLTFTQADAIHADGWVEESFGKPGNRLYINRGIGMSLLPLRFNCLPEVTFFTLRAGGD